MMKALVLRYFSGVDNQDISLILETLAPDCVFSVETHGVRLQGHEAITAMFERLWSHHLSVLHDQFHFAEDSTTSIIAVRFQVTNQLHDGSTIHKSNCNFFTVKDGLFTEVRVYMAGENTLDKSD